MAFNPEKLDQRYGYEIERKMKKIPLALLERGSSSEGGLL